MTKKIIFITSIILFFSNLSIGQDGPSVYYGMEEGTWDADNVWYHNVIETKNAWEITKGSNDIVIVYLCREGINWEHEKLRTSYDNINRTDGGEEVWNTWNGFTGDGIDNDGNGVVDDWRGIKRLIIPQTYVNNTLSTIYDPNEIDGTWLSGIIGGINEDVTFTEDFYSIAGGVNQRGVSVVPFSYDGLPDGSHAWLWNKALDYAIEIGAEIFLYDFCTLVTSSMELKLQEAHEAGIFIVAPSGWDGANINQVYDPAGFTFPWSFIAPTLESVFSVGGSTKPDIDGEEFRHSLAHYGEYPDEDGEFLDLVAPAEKIYTTSSDISGGDDEYKWVQGNAASAAMVAATAGLMLSVNPDLETYEIRDILRETADKISNEANGGDYDYDWDSQHPGHSKECGYGRLNTYKAVCAALATAPPPVVVNGAVWDEPKFSLNDIVVPADYTLTITSTVYLGSEARFIIEPGATVTVDGGTLTNYKFCGNEDGLWLGVEVWGNDEKSQYIDPTDGIQWQGKLIMKNGAVIENAEFGVLLSARDGSSDDFDDDKNGGVITVANSGDPASPGAFFMNNKKSVVFRIYNNYNPVNPLVQMSNITTLKNCHFEINTDYLGGAWWYAHIYAYGVNGVKIAGCTFENNKTASPMGHGINAWAAGFRVEAICNTTSIPCPQEYLDKCTFTNFGKAINNNYSGYRTIYVSDADFFNNSYGVKLDMVNNATVIFSNFNIGYNDKEAEGCENTSISRGIDISNSVGFTIEENYFTRATGVPDGDYLGIRINESKTRYDLIYRNTFEGLDYGNYAEGLNRQNPDDDRDGLEYQCNDNTANEVDFIVTGPQNTYPQIRTFQGLSSKAAGNTFSPTATMHFQNDGTQVIDYFHTSGQAPVYYTPFYVQPILTSIENGCESNYGGTSGGDDRGMVLSDEERQDQELIYAQALSDFSNVSVLYENLKDGGNTENLQTEIELSWPNDMWALRAELLGKSPHLSKEVLMTAADKTDVLPDAVLFEILTANPDELRKDELIKYLEDKENPLPEYMIAILRDLAGGITYKTVLQQQMANYSALQVKSANKIIRSISMDEEMDFGDYRDWLDNLGGMRADEMIISSYLAEGNYTDAITLLNLLPTLYDLQGEELVKYQDYSIMINALKTVDQDNRSITEFTDEEIANMVGIAENGIGKGQDMARGILNFAYGYEYCDCPQPGGGVGTKSSIANPKAYQEAFGAQISVEPNPAGEWAVFNYELPLNETSGSIKISDVSGRLTQVLAISGSKGQKVWDTRNVKNGVYFYSITINGISTNGKIIVNK